MSEQHRYCDRIPPPRPPFHTDLAIVTAAHRRDWRSGHLVTRTEIDYRQIGWPPENLIGTMRDHFELTETGDAFEFWDPSSAWRFPAMMSRRLFWCLGLIILFGGAGPTSAAPRPNIILIMADDFGYECVRANGATSYETPHLDRLATTGVRFTHCYAQPLCTPTRVQLMTGQSNVRNYVRFGYLDPQQTTFAHLLKRAGYTTGIVGKWQLGHGFKGPAQFGFDEYCLWQLTRRPPRYANPGLEIDGREVDFKTGEYGPDIVHKYALDFISKHQTGPFLLYYPMMLTHGPFQPTPDSGDWDPHARGEDVNNDPAHFSEMVRYVDKQIGTLVQRLDELKLRDNTLLLFLGDNGTGQKIRTPLAGKTVQGGKGRTDETGMRVPLIANWPGKIPAGRVCEDLIDTTDFLPTLCAAAGAERPPVLDGRDFLPQLLGERGQPREWLYCWYSPNQNKVDVPVVFARDHEFKLYGSGRFVKLDEDGYREVEVTSATAPAEATAARTKLEKVLSDYADARPAALRDAPVTKAKKKKR